MGCDDVSILKSASQLKVTPVTSAELLSKIQITEGAGCVHSDTRRGTEGSLNIDVLMFKKSEHLNNQRNTHD